MRPFPSEIKFLNLPADFFLCSEFISLLRHQFFHFLLLSSGWSCVCRAKWLCFHRRKCNIEILLPWGLEISLVRTHQVLYWNCHCEQIILRQNPIFQRWFFCQFCFSDAGMDKGESSGVFTELCRNWKWYNLCWWTSRRASKFPRQLYGKSSLRF